MSVYGKRFFKPKIKVYPEKKPEPPKPPPRCTIDDWNCSEWEPEICPESGKQIRTCKLENTTCLNQEIVKPSEIQNCIYVPPPQPNKSLWQKFLNFFILPVLIGIFLYIILPPEEWKKKKKKEIKNKLRKLFKG